MTAKFQVVRRATLLIPSNPQGNLSSKHLFVVMCDPRGPQKDVLLAQMATYIGEHTGHDSTCLLNQGDHPFIRHTSYIRYQHPRQDFAHDLVRGVATGLYVDRGLIDESVFERIHAGFYISELSPNFAFEFLK